MNVPHLATRTVREERGGVLVFVALALPILIVFLSLVVDVANWFEHKRHLQLQADAAALAGAGGFAIPCGDGPIVDLANKYSGAPGSLYNAQVGGTDPNNVHIMINSPAYYNQSSPTDSAPNTGSPCADKAIDVKLTETDLPWFFRIAQIPFINTHARVSIKQLNVASGAIPVAVPDVNPKKARVWFVDEDKPEGDPDSVLGESELTRTGFSNGLAIWDNVITPVPVEVEGRNIGVRVALSGSTSTTCDDPLVECYDLGSSNGALYARGWSGENGNPDAPHDGEVTLFADTVDDCNDPYFSSNTSTCTIGVRAKVDTDPTTRKAKLLANIGGNKNYQLTYDAASGLWESPPSDRIPIDPATGPVPIELKWEEADGTRGAQTCTIDAPCKGTFGVVQRTFSAAAARSGPIKTAQIFENGAFWANSFERCSAVQASCTHDLVVKIGIQGTLEDAQSVSDPIHELRFAGGVSGSQNQALDCDPWQEDPAIGGGTRSFVDELAYGCRPAYTKNTGTACPSSPNDLWNLTPQPWQCVAVETGDRVNQIPTGLNLRILGTTKPTSCTSPNNWSMFPDFPAGDPRIVQIFLTSFGAFSSNGQNTVPVTNFATFYVTGWKGSGGGGKNPCQGKGDDPVTEVGVIKGHFIKYVKTLNEGDNGTEPCDFSGFGSCVAVLTE